MGVRVSGEKRLTVFALRGTGVNPGRIQLTRTPLLKTSFAKTRVNVSIPLFAIEYPAKARESPSAATELKLMILPKPLFAIFLTKT